MSTATAEGPTLTIHDRVTTLPPGDISTTTDHESSSTHSTDNWPSTVTTTRTVDRESIERTVLIGALSGAVPAGVLFTLLLVTLGVLIVVLIRRNRPAEGKSPHVSPKHIETAPQSDDSAVVVAKSTNRILRQNVDYAESATEIQLAANPAYLTTRKENGGDIISTMPNVAYFVVASKPEKQELKKVVNAPAGNPLAMAAYTSIAKDSVYEEYDYIVERT